MRALKRIYRIGHYPIEGGKKLRFWETRQVGTAVARMNREVSLDKPAVPDSTHGSQAPYENFQALVMQALQLRKAYREVFILCDIRGYSSVETAAILSISEDSVLRRLNRARAEMGFAGEDGSSAIAKLVDL